MLDYVLPLLLVTPFIAVGAIAFHQSHSFWSVLVVLLSAIAGAVLIGLSGIYWLQILHRRWMESQAAGFIFLPVTLPICAYTGAVAGASLMIMLYRYQGSELLSPVFEVIAIGLSVVLSGLIPAAIATINFSISDEVSKFTVAPILIVCAAVASSWVASELAYLLVINLYK
ncbi:hypothetical protein HCG51_04840 [Tolypothrix sp. PCC 7910]|uniref:hypothetical protein n=1 Tax=Tolypothrix sp. PCC 7910 TaxID=2099387 RepID=UPI0014279949|nr:hypothetical protein [Tolypothrix sp. PCC 7910]QIR36157.1 hypothetical protein HCG51_04840 [Tolypothrix sp. PCC 7910]